MCGIFGIIDQQNRPVNPSFIRSGCALIAHRGPDGQGIYEGTHWAFGHRRLAVIDLSEKGQQPMAYRDKLITYNGEIYNYPELRVELEAAGYQFRSDSDTEVLLAAYCHWGRNCLHHFNGMWAFAIYDAARQEIFCARDRFGIKPFYYCLSGGQFCFASEIKQFTALPHWQARLNQVRAWEFLVNAYHDHTSETLFEGVLQLAAGHSLTYDLQSHRFQTRSYYRLEADQLSYSLKNSGDAIGHFYDLFEDAVRIRLRSDVKTGTALSGGLDSSSIVCMIRELLEKSPSKDQQMSISACFEEEAIDERPYIRAVQNQTKVDARLVFPRFDQLFSELDRIIWHQDEPIAGAGVFAQQQVFKAARENGITVMLDGQGADEILCGYEKFYLPWLKTQLRQQPLKVPGNIVRFFNLHRIGPAEVVRSGRQFFRKLKNEKVGWLNIDQEKIGERMFRRVAESNVLDTSLNALYGVGLPVLLHYEDRNSMAASVESRLPFLDYRLVEFCLSLPDDLKIHKSVRKYVLREAMKPLLPGTVYSRYDKLGYATPQQQWMREHQGVFQKELNAAIDASQGLISKDLLPSGDPGLDWRIISFGRWMQLFELNV